MMIAPIAAPTPIRAVPRIVPTTIPTGIETTPAPTKAPIRAIETSRVGPPRTISIKPRIVPPIVGIPRRPPCVTNIYIHVYGSIRIIRIITIRVITIAHIKIDLVGPRDRNLARRMITNDSLRIFRIRATLGRKLLPVAIFLHIFIPAIRLLYLHGRITTVIRVHVPVIGRSGLASGRHRPCGSSDGLLLGLNDFFLFNLFAFFLTFGREIHIIKEFLLSRDTKRDQKHQHDRCQSHGFHICFSSTLNSFYFDLLSRKGFKRFFIL